MEQNQTPEQRQVTPIEFCNGLAKNMMDIGMVLDRIGKENDDLKKQLAAMKASPAAAGVPDAPK